MAAGVEPLFCVDRLTVDLALPGGNLRAVNRVSFEVVAGETLCIVGESGSGKSMTARAIMNLLPLNARRSAEVMRLEGTDLTSLEHREIARLNGDRMSMIFQDPMTSFNPVYTVGFQLEEAYLHHKKGSRREARERAEYLLHHVGIGDPRLRLRQYPHQLSGGLRQRMMIAMALMCEPALLLADEPTTALDVTIQSQVLDLLDDLRREFRMGMVLITHDFGVVARMADKVQVMYAGEVVEQGSAHQVIRSPQHPYTAGLLACLPNPHAGTDANRRLYSIPGTAPRPTGKAEGCAFRRRCGFAISECENGAIPLHQHEDGHDVRCTLSTTPAVKPLTLGAGSTKQGPPQPLGETVLACNDLGRSFHLSSGIFSRKVPLQAVSGVNLDVARGQVLAIVGESGSGKTTLARMLLGILSPSEGTVALEGKAIDGLTKREVAQKIQPVFQDPYASLNPTRTVEASIALPLNIHGVGSKGQRKARVTELMDLVGLPQRLRYAYPSQLSGGQRQRVAICRALALNPSILICDEPTSALDVSIQAQILNLFNDLREEMNLTYVLISHDLGVVGHLADEIAVMYRGKIVEYGPANRLLSSPQHTYTQRLLSSVLSIGTPSVSRSLTGTGPEP